MLDRVKVLEMRPGPYGPKHPVEVWRLLTWTAVQEANERMDSAGQNGHYLRMMATGGPSARDPVFEVRMGYPVAWLSIFKGNDGWIPHGLGYIDGHSGLQLLRALMVYFLGDRPLTEAYRIKDIASGQMRMFTKGNGLAFPMPIPDDVIPTHEATVALWEEPPWFKTRLEAEVAELVARDVLPAGITWKSSGIDEIVDGVLRKKTFQFELGVYAAAEDWVVRAEAPSEPGVPGHFKVYRQKSERYKDDITGSGWSLVEALIAAKVFVPESQFEELVRSWGSGVFELHSVLPEETLTTYRLLGEEPLLWRTDEFLPWWEFVTSGAPRVP